VAHAAPDFARIAWAAPLAGAVVGLIGGAVLLLAQALALPAFLASALAFVAMAFATGGLHEDGLADVADGFGGGATREAKLAILKDSRLGAYGALALGLALFLRIGALSSAHRDGLGFAVAALTLASAAARAGALWPLASLPPARPDGAGAAAGRLPMPAARAAALTALALALVLGLGWLGVVRALFALTLAAASAYGVAALARRQIGGQTGDVAGAAALIVEIATLIALLIGGRAS